MRLIGASIIALILLQFGLARAETVSVDMSYTDYANSYVIIWYSKTPDLQSMSYPALKNGVKVTDAGQEISIGGFKLGETWYFRPRAYDKVSNKPSAWGNEFVKIMAYDAPVFEQLPEVPDTVVPVPNSDIIITIKVQQVSQ